MLISDYIIRGTYHGQFCNMAVLISVLIAIEDAYLWYRPAACVKYTELPDNKRIWVSP